MKEETLSQQALDVVKSYSNLKIGNKSISCPYFNNRKSKVRGGVKARVGKGSPSEVTEEVNITSKKEDVNLEKLDKDEVKKFLVEKNIGVDCSAFVYHVLNAELKANSKESLKDKIKFPNKSWLRKIIIKFRTVENINVGILSHPQNSTEVSLNKIKPGDFISILKSGGENDRDHIIIAHKIKYKDETPKQVHYSHSFRWSSDGKYNHGISQGKIVIKDTEKSLLEQEWTEKDKKNESNETYQRAQQAKNLSVRRLNVLT